MDVETTSIPTRQTDLCTNIYLGAFIRKPQKTKLFSSELYRGNFLKSVDNRPIFPTLTPTEPRGDYLLGILGLKLQVPRNLLNGTPTSSRMSQIADGSSLLTMTMANYKMCTAPRSTAVSPLINYKLLA